MNYLSVWNIVLQIIESQAMNTDAKTVLFLFLFFAIVSRLNLDLLVLSQFSFHNLKGWDKQDVFVCCQNSTTEWVA